MAGRGRGRGGRGRGMSFSVEALGFGRGESLPGPILQPPAIFPPLDFKPVPLAAGEEYDYLLALKQEFRAAMKESPYYIKTPEKKKDIERYSDKYQMNGQDGESSWEPDWSRLPKELRPKIRKRRKVNTGQKPNLSLAAKKIKPNDILEQLEKQEKGDEAVEEKEDEEKEEDEDEENIEEEFHDDEDLEDDNDYNLNYFDNGEGYGADEDDDLDEGPVY